VIRFQGVTKLYPNSARPALEDASVEIEKGEFVFLVGQSGSGKSTFLRLVLKEEKPTKGQIWVAGKELSRLSHWKIPALRRQIGTVFQDFRLLPNKTVHENVAFALEVIGKPRHTIARAFVNRPMILIADEPTGNLDPSTSVGIMRLLDRINRTGTTVVMATHDSHIVDSMRRRVIELEHGHVTRDQSRGVYGYAR